MYEFTGYYLKRKKNLYQIKLIDTKYMEYSIAVDILKRRGTMQLRAKNINNVYNQNELDGFSDLKSKQLFLNFFNGILFVLSVCDEFYIKYIITELVTF